MNRIQRWVGRAVKVGHAGTLDPMARGVLLVCLGRATRLVPLIHEFSKSYRAGFTLGASSDTDDATGHIQYHPLPQPPTHSQVEQHLRHFQGQILQRPPSFSAIRVDGRRAYQAARQGQPPNLQPRPVQVHRIRLLSYVFPHLELEIECGSGTYIRSLARDLGQSLGTAGLMHALVRTRIGPFDLDHAAILPQIESSPATPDSPLIQDVESLFTDWPQHRLKAAEIKLLRDGKPMAIASDEPRLVALTEAGRFAAVLARLPSGEYRGGINWVPAWFNG